MNHIVLTAAASIQLATAQQEKPYRELCLIPAFPDGFQVGLANVTAEPDWVCGDGHVTVTDKDVFDKPRVTRYSSLTDYVYNETKNWAAFKLTNDDGTDDGGNAAPLKVQVKCDPTGYKTGPSRPSIRYDGDLLQIELTSWQACRDYAVVQTLAEQAEFIKGKGYCGANLSLGSLRSAEVACTTSVMDRCVTIFDFPTSNTCDFRVSNLSFTTTPCGRCHKTSAGWTKVQCLEKNGLPYGVEFYKCPDSCGSCEHEPFVNGTSFVFPGGNEGAEDGACVAFSTTQSAFIGGISDCATFAMEGFASEDCSVPANQVPELTVDGSQSMPFGLWDSTQTNNYTGLSVDCVNQPRVPSYLPKATDNIVVRTSVNQFCASESEYITRTAGACFTQFDSYQQKNIGVTTMCDEFPTKSPEEQMCADVHFYHYSEPQQNESCPQRVHDFSSAFACDSCNIYAGQYWKVTCNHATREVTIQGNCAQGCSDCQQTPTVINNDNCTVPAWSTNTTGRLASLTVCNTVTIKTFADTNCSGEAISTTKAATRQCNGHESYQCVPQEYLGLVSYKKHECDTVGTRDEGFSSETCNVIKHEDGSVAQTEMVQCDGKPETCVHATEVDLDGSLTPVHLVCGECFVNENGSVMYDCKIATQSVTASYYRSLNCTGSAEVSPPWSFKNPTHHPTNTTAAYFGGLTECATALYKRWNITNGVRTGCYYDEPHITARVPQGTCNHDHRHIGILTCANLLDDALPEINPAKVTSFSYNDPLTCANYSEHRGLISDAKNNCVPLGASQFEYFQCTSKGFCFNLASISLPDDDVASICIGDEPTEITTLACGVCQKGGTQWGYFKYACDVFGEKVELHRDCDSECGNCTRKMNLDYMGCGGVDPRAGWRIASVRGMFPCDTVTRRIHSSTACSPDSLITTEVYQSGACNPGETEGTRYYCGSIDIDDDGGQEGSKSGLSTGAKAAIGVCVSALVLGAIAAAVVVYRKKQMKGTGQSDDANYEMMAVNE